MKKTKTITVFSIAILILIILSLISAKAGSLEMSFSKLINGLLMEILM